MSKSIQIQQNSTSWLNAEEIAFVKKQFFPLNANAQDIAFCLEVAKSYNLNPILRQIFFVPRKFKDDNGAWHEKVEPLVGRDGFLAIAHKMGNFGGIETTSVLKEVPCQTNGKWGMKQDLVGICKVFKKGCDKPFVVEVAYSEYVQKTRNGEPTQFWANKPDTMIKKVAESQALRKAFNICGLMSLEEVGVGTQQEGGSDVIIDTETIESQIDVEAENTLLAVKEQEALAQFGLSSECKAGWIKVVGNTYNLKNQLSSLGYSLHKSQSGESIWAKKLA